MREVARGLAAAVAALFAMAGVAAAGLALLGTGGVGLTAAVVASAVGGRVEVEAMPAGVLPVAVRGELHVIPLGLSLAGAMVLGWLLLRRRDDGLLVRGAAAAVAFPAALTAIALLAKGKPPLPEGIGGGCVSAGPRLPWSGHLDAGFSVAVGPAVLGGVVWALVVVGVCWLVARFPFVAKGFRAARWPSAGLVVVCLAAAWTFGGAPAAGGVLLVLPQLVSGAVLLGLGVPWTVDTTGALSCVPDIGHFTPGLWVSGALLLGCGIAVAVRRRPLRRAAAAGAVVGGVSTVMTLLSHVSLDVAVTAFGFSVPVLDARLTANPLLALLAGALAGFAGCLLVDAISVSSRAWKR
ncbi:streptophobe family protein [Amycolatopsis sp. NPDC051371]|uniref:streptophobe family protein n=1 Tax=Amycolatopsis sp. NPDC051371 TaxID=3155800 RepID=UPI00342E140C